MSVACQVLAENVNTIAARVLTDLNTFTTTSYLALIMVYFLSILEEMGEGALWRFFGSCD